MGTLYILKIINNMKYIFEAECINDIVTSYSGIISSNCSSVFKYLLIQDKSCERSLGVVRESYWMNNTNGYCVVKDKDFYDIKDMLSFGDLQVEVVSERKDTLSDMISVLLRFSLIALALSMISYCFISAFKVSRIQRSVEPLYIIGTIPRPPLQRTITRNDYSTLDEIPNDQECSICMELLEKETVQLPCEHMYHKECIDQWFSNSNRCPLCNNEGNEGNV